jgi:hypothetical protein
MPDMVLLPRARMRPIDPFFPRSRGLPRVNDRRVVSSSRLSATGGAARS